MSSFFGFAIVMLVIFLIIAFLIGLIRAVFRVFSFLTENETESINNQEKSKNKQQKNLLWLGIGVLLGKSSKQLFGLLEIKVSCISKVWMRLIISY